MVAWTAINLDYIQLGYGFESAYAGTHRLDNFANTTKRPILDEKVKPSMMQFGQTQIYRFYPNLSHSNQTKLNDFEFKWVTFEVCRAMTWDILVELGISFFINLILLTIYTYLFF